MSDMRSASSTTAIRTASRDLPALDEVGQTAGQATAMSIHPAQRLDLAVVAHASVEGRHPLAAHVGQCGQLDATCEQSSRVGVSTRTWGCGAWPAPCRAGPTGGDPKASVLPAARRGLAAEVAAARASGMEAAWTGNGSVMERGARAATRSDGTPRSAKEGGMIALSSGGGIPAATTRRSGRESV